MRILVSNWSTTTEDVDRLRREEASEPWIRQEIIRREQEEGRVCVLVTIVQPPDVDFMLLTADCPRSGGARANPARKRTLGAVEEAWTQCG
jgi:hypothetical protein